MVAIQFAVAILAIAVVSASIVLVWEVRRWMRKWQHGGVGDAPGIIDRYRASLEAEREAAQEITNRLAALNKYLSSTAKEMRARVDEMIKRGQDRGSEPLVPVVEPRVEFSDDDKLLRYRAKKSDILDRLAYRLGVEVIRIEKTDEPGIYMSTFVASSEEAQKDIEEYGRELLKWSAMKLGGVWEQSNPKLSRQSLGREEVTAKKGTEYARLN